ncbi:MAG: FtsW/RodA/SpoVE family cell cycle protein [Alphaproteobacteria bacterium]
MIVVARTDTSLFGRWWWTIDRWTLLAFVLLMGLGAILIMAASPAVADRLGVDPFYFVRRQLAYLLPAAAVMLATSLLSPRGVRRLALAGFAVGVALLVVTLVAGHEVNGARRWLRLGTFSLQASEFVKPFFAVVAAWLFAAYRLNPGFPGNLLCAAFCVLLLGLLVLQPDFGMALMVAAVWFAQYFFAGLGFGWVALFGALGLAGLVAGYVFLPHVASRIDRFFDPGSGDNFQVDTALSAFTNGGLFGRGPGEGVVKESLPDAHSDFIFAVAGEEFGLLFCLVIVAIFAFIVLRGFGRALQGRSLFAMLAAGGLLAGFGLQALVHMGVTLRLLPPTGMTLPFVSYGGSSIFAVALGMGMLLALTRRRAGAGELP